MASVNAELLNQQINHAVSLVKFGSHLSKEVNKLLDTILSEMSDVLAARLVKIREAGYDTGPATTKRITQMLDDIRPLISDVYAKTYDKLETDLTELANHEAKWQVASLNKAITVDLKAVVPSPTLLQTVATETSMNGYLLKPYVDGMEAGTVARIDQAVRVGVATGQGIEDIVRSIKGTKAANYRDGVIETSRRSARTLVRTAVNHVANQAAQETYKRNEHLIDQYQWVSVLDDRTTIECGDLDGQIFDVGDGPLPPAHLACRSTTIPITKSFEELGLPAREYDAQSRASMDGEVPQRTTFAEWLPKQSTERQVAVLGATRQKLYADGKLDLRDFLRGNHEVMTLDELKRQHPDAF